MAKQNLHFTRAAVLVEMNGEVLLLNLSNSAWNGVLEIANADGGGQLQAAKVPNQNVLDALENQATSKLPGELAELIRSAQSHMQRTPEADKISIALSQYLNG